MDPGKEDSPGNEPLSFLYTPRLTGLTRSDSMPGREQAGGGGGANASPIDGGSWRMKPTQQTRQLNC